MWSLSAIGCTPDVSGSLDALDKMTANKHALVGICARGFNLVMQPVRCKALKVTRLPDRIEVLAGCSVKDYAVKRFSIGIRNISQDSISFDENDFNGQDFSVSGEYRRYSKKYQCEGLPR